MSKRMIQPIQSSVSMINPWRCMSMYESVCECTGVSVLKQHCEAIGRDYDEILRIAMYETTIAAPDDEALQQAYQGDIPDERTREGDLIGSLVTLRRRLQEIEEAGVSHYYTARASLPGTRVNIPCG